MKSQQDEVLRSKILGAMLRKTRKESGKSIKETAAMIGSTSGKLSAYEEGKRNISLPELELFAYHINEAMDNMSSITRPYEYSQMLDVMFGSFCLGK